MSSTAFPCVAETLEARQLLSSVSFADGILTLQGNTSANNSMTVDLRDGGKNVVGLIGNVYKTVALSSITGIKINGGSGKDVVYVNPGITKPTTIQGGAGDDSLRGGGGNDSILGGDGNDTLLGWNGNDTIFGGNGNDYINGGYGNDTVKGEAGTNNVTGGTGDDIVQVNSSSPVTGGTSTPTTPPATSTPPTTGSTTATPGTVSFANGVLTLAAKADSQVTVDLRENGTKVVGMVNNVYKLVTRTSLKSLVIIGTSGKDYFYVNPEIQIPTVIDGKGGSDTYRGRASSGTVVPPPTTPSTGASITEGWTTVSKSNSNSAAPQLVVKILGQRIIAGQQTHVNALSGTIPSGTPLTAKYDWNFGDSGSKYNTLRGWNAAHAYEKAGNYTLTLTVTDEGGRVTTLSTTITVLADTRRSIYVSAVGNDANDGTTPEKAVKSVGRINALMGDNVKILFRRGDKISSNQDINISRKNVTVGAYGTGNRPILFHTEGGTPGMISVYQNATNTVVRDIVFDTGELPKGNMAQATLTHAIYVAGSNISVRGCEFLNINYAVNSFRKPTGLLVQDNTAPLLTGIRGYLVWGEGSDHVYLGNKMENSTREHVFRAVGVTGILVAFNDVRNADRSAIDGPDYSKGCIEIHDGSWAYIFGNKVQDGALRVGPRGSDLEPTTTATDWVVIERNEINNTAIRVVPGAHHVFIRNNVVKNTTNSAGINIVGRDDDGRIASDITIANNTGYNTGSAGSFIRVDTEPKGVTLTNNLYVMPNMATGGGSASVYVGDNDLAGFKSISYNVWQKPKSILLWAQGGVNWVRSTFGDAAGYKDVKEWDAYSQVSNDAFSVTSLSGWAPTTTSTAANYAVKIAGVFEDFYGNSRPTSGRMTAGAVEV